MYDAREDTYCVLGARCKVLGLPLDAYHGYDHTAIPKLDELWQLNDQAGYTFPQLAEPDEAAIEAWSRAFYPDAWALSGGQKHRARLLTRARAGLAHSINCILGEV